MISFIDATTCRTEIKRLLEDGKSLRAAVAYWGEGAIKELGINANTDLTVICDVRGGGSNPAEVKKLIRLLGKQRVLTHDRLHAKIWVAEDKAIVGSSNASSNGLGKEGREVTSLLEANLLIDDRVTIDALNTWLDHEVLPGARMVTDDDLKVAFKRHGPRRDSRPTPEAGDLLSLLRAEPESFIDRNFLVWVWDPCPTSKAAQKEIRVVQDERLDKDIEFYQDCEAPAGAYILDFEAKKGGGKFVGLYQVLKDGHRRRLIDGSGSFLLLCKRAPGDTFEGLHLGNLETWSAAARRAARSDHSRNEWKIVDFAKQFLIDNPDV